MGRVLGGFQYQVERILTGRLPRRWIDIKWEYTLAAVAREEVVLNVTEEYIRIRHNMVAQFIDMISLMELCKETERKPGAQVGMWWY